MKVSLILRAVTKQNAPLTLSYPLDCLLPEDTKISLSIVGKEAEVDYTVFSPRANELRLFLKLVDGTNHIYNLGGEELTQFKLQGWKAL